jgi:carotenoid cleavage dioxygenase
MNLEFPTFDARSGGSTPALLYAPVVTEPTNTPYFNAIASIDVERGGSDVYRYGADVMAEEHRFVPRPGSGRPGEGWLVGTLLDSGRNRTGIAVLDAERVSAGPIAKAWLPYVVPLGFHGAFASSQSSVST